ncbi:hypothetical protein [Lysobacter terrae]
MKIFPIIAIALIGLSACSLLGGPSDKQVEDLARQSMAESLGDGDASQRAALLAVAKSATVRKKGLCNHDTAKDVYACAVDVTVKMPGADQETTQAFIVLAKKEADGTWKSVE